MKNLLLLFVLLCCFNTSCTPNQVVQKPQIVNSGGDGQQPDEPQPDQPDQPGQPEEPDQPDVPDPQPLLAWNDVTSEYGELPEYITILKSEESFTDGTKIIAYMSVADIKKGAKWEVLGDLAYCDDSKIINYGANKAMTPSEFYDECKAPIIINGGLFYWAAKSDGSSFYISQNLAIRDGKMIGDNINYYSEDWKTIWYPTIGAFCEDANGKFFTTWTYTNNGTTYTYPQPADNSMDKKPLPLPNATEPKGAERLNSRNIVNGIGGVGVLICAGELVSTWRQELLNVVADSNHPRTAIGYNAAKEQLVFFVCEGRNMTEGVAGLTVDKVGEVLLEFGCTEALNLDGGGSSCMLINGKQTIKPSDGKQRSVLTAIKMY